MRRHSLVLMVLGVVAPALSGCMNQPNARYIYQDGTYGVIGIPQNTPFGKRNYNKQAVELMVQHFPGGYEVIRAEEVVEGQRILDKGKTTQYETEPTIAAANQTIKLGKLAESMTTQQKDSLPILESRIIYRRRMPDGPPGFNGYSALASMTPEFYLDPNEIARCRARTEIADAKKGGSTAIASKTDAKGADGKSTTGKPGDSSVQKTALDTTTTPTPPPAK